MIPESAVYLGIKVIVLQKNYFSKKKNHIWGFCVRNTNKRPTQQLDRPDLPNAIRKENRFIFIQNRNFSIPLISGMAYKSPHLGYFFLFEKIIQVEAGFIL